MHLKVGTLLQGGKYKIIRFIKSGGFGCTYEAQHTFFDVRVAIKEFFPKDFCNRDDSTLHVTVGTQSKSALVSKLRRKFIDEAVILYKLRHPGIVTVSDVFEENGTAYYVMDYIDGCSLDDIVRREGALPESKALSYIRQVCSALEFVHSQNRLHLDIKPGNVMVDNAGHTILIDFGTSKQYDEENGENTSTIMGMTPGYAPLEQYKRGGVQQFTPATDIYSLGATLYKLLAGTTPPDANEIYEDGLPALPSNLSPAVCSAVEKAMTPRRKDRPQSVAEFLAIISADNSFDITSEPELKPIAETVVKAEDATEIFVEPLDISDLIYFRDGVLNVNGIQYPMVKVEGGTFTMGNGGIFSDCRRHEVTLDGYSIGKYQVTQDIWEAVMGDNPSQFHGSRRPVERVSWDDCQDFIRKLNELTGQNFRLPTEAEWEFAARGGKDSWGYQYSGAEIADKVAWFSYNSEGETRPVGIKAPNELGIHDMSGNVCEWCSDLFGKYKNTPQYNPKGLGDTLLRVIRGGSWDSYVGRVDVCYRDSWYPANRSYEIGLRLCMDYDSSLIGNKHSGKRGDICI